MSARARVGAVPSGLRRALALLVVLGTACPVNSDASAEVEAPASPYALHTDAAPASSNAQPKGAGFAVPRHVIAGGGGTSSGGAFAISGTIGQADADPLQPSSGGAFAIAGGFWGSAPSTPEVDAVFANGFE